ncbi:MAG: dihydrolipoamide acetyltransferase family protein [Myxococcota bacterium]
MAEFYEMPSISPTMEVGTLVEWKIAEGQSFESSAVVAEVGTDKANMEAEIFDPGVMLKHLIAEGDEVPPGFPIAIVGQAGEDVSALMQEFESRKATMGAAEAPAAEPAAPAPAPAPVAAPAPAAPPPAPVNGVTTDITRSWHGQTLSRDFADPPGDVRFATEGSTRVLASPLARKVAAERGVDLRRVSGTGPAGRITRADVERAPAGGGMRLPSGPVLQEQVIRNAPIRKTIAKRLLESHTQIPTFFLTVSYDMLGFVEMRKALKAQLPDVKISYNDILIKAVARALVDHPEVNASWSDQAITHHGRVDIGVAVAIEGGLITPVIRNADSKPLSDVAGEVRELAGRAREQRLKPEEYTGGTFTISNLGMFGIEHFTAIINPPESAILAVGGIEEVPLAKDGVITTGFRMNVTMTCDHRVIDGAVGAAFLQTLRKYVENPWLSLQPNL